MICEYLEMLNDLSDEKNEEIYKSLNKDFNAGKRELAKKLSKRILSYVDICEDREVFSADLNKSIIDEINNYFGNLLSEEETFIKSDDIPEVEKMVVGKDELKDTFTHDMIVGGATILGATALGLLLKKFAGKTGGISGALIGGFIGSAAGSAIGEDFIEKDYSEEEKINIEKFKEKFKKVLENILEKIIENRKEKILKKTKENLREIVKSKLEILEGRTGEDSLDNLTSKLEEIYGIKISKEENKNDNATD